MVCSSVITSIHISLLMCYQVGGLSTIAPEGQKPTNDKTNWFFFLQIIYLCPFRNGEPDFLYARSWLPWFFFSGVVTFGSIGRQLAMVCFCSWSEPHFSSKILFTLERNGANTVPIRSDDTNVPYRLCNFKALEQA